MFALHRAQQQRVDLAVGRGCLLQLAPHMEVGSNEIHARSPRVPENEVREVDGGDLVKRACGEVSVGDCRDGPLEDGLLRGGCGEDLA